MGIRKADHLKQLTHPLDQGRRIQTEQLPVKGQELLGRKILIEIRSLGEKTHKLFHGDVFDRAPEDPGPAGRGEQEAEQELNRGGLARPVMTEEAEDLPLLHFQVQVIQRHETLAPETETKLLGEAGDLDRLHRGLLGA